MVTCNNQHEFATENVDWNNVPDSQARDWRHKCGACAYDQGYNDGLEAAANRVSEMFTNEFEDLRLE